MELEPSQALMMLTAGPGAPVDICSLMLRFKQSQMALQSPVLGVNSVL